MTLPAGTVRLGPENGTLSVKTGRGGAAAKAGHDLLIHLEAWEATIEALEDPELTRVALDAVSTSLRVREGTGGIGPLGEDERASIHATIDDDVLRRQAIEFRSTQVEPGADGRLTVAGDLTLAGETRPIAFDLVVGDGGELHGSVVLKQSDWGIKPYSTLFGALKVADEVEVALDARLPSG